MPCLEKSLDFIRKFVNWRFFDVSRLCNFERTTPTSCVHLGSKHTCYHLGPQPGALKDL